MPTDAMLSIAAENLETKMDVIVEEQHRAGLIKPLHIWISEWVGLENLNKKRNLWKCRLTDLMCALFCTFPVLSVQPATS